MLANAGRRYLLSIFSSAHNIAAVGAGVQQLPEKQPDLCLSFSRLVCTTVGPSAERSSGAPDLQQQLQQQRQDGVLPAAQADDPQLFSDDASASASDPVLQPAQQPNIAAVGPRKVDPSRFGGSKGPGPKREGVVHVNSTFNNTHLVLTDRSSKVETWVSGGTVGYKNANKASPMAAELAAKELARRAIDKGFHAVVVKLKGMGKNKQFAVQSLAAAGLTVTQIWDVTPIPYNGCRLPRRRRV